MRLSVNPFIFGRALVPEEFVGRERELPRLFSRLATGQSVAIIGQPHIGKTSLMKFVLDPQVRRAQLGDRFEHDVFSFLDAQMLNNIQDQASFWRTALEPVKAFPRSDKYSDLMPFLEVLETATQNNFGSFVLEQFFRSVCSSGVRLFLFLDEFDAFLDHPGLHSAEFYGSLRALASHSGGLVIVIASRQSLEELNRVTQEINPHGSPYLNVFTSLNLGALSESELQKLLDRAGKRFSAVDREYVKRVSGGHPYLAQTAAAMLWEAGEEGITGAARYEAAGRDHYWQTRQHFSDTWRVWSQSTRKVITCIALGQIPELVGSYHFHTSDWIEDISEYRLELDALEVSGVLTQTNDQEWRVNQDALLWWLADELITTVRDDVAFKDWLLAQEMDGLFTQGQRQKFGQAAKKIVEITGHGAMTLVESLAKSIGEGLGKGISGSGGT